MVALGARYKTRRESRSLNLARWLRSSRAIILFFFFVLPPSLGFLRKTSGEAKRSARACVRTLRHCWYLKKILVYHLFPYSFVRVRIYEYGEREKKKDFQCPKEREDQGGSRVVHFRVGSHYLYGRRRERETKKELVYFRIRPGNWELAAPLRQDD